MEDGVRRRVEQRGAIERLMTDTVRAAVQTAAEEIEIRAFYLPSVGDGEALVRVEACGVCGADYERYYGGMDDSGLFEYPVVLGHEPVGRIETIDEDAAERWGVAEGDRVAVEPFAPCGVCEHCTAGRYTLCDSRFIYGTTTTTVGDGLWGGFADYMLLQPNSVVHRLDPDLSVEDAVLFNPLGAGYEWVCVAGDVRTGDDVLVLGPGQRGVSAVMAADDAGAGEVVVTGLPADEWKFDIATDFGATGTVDVTDTAIEDVVAAYTDGRGFDVVVDTTPAATQPVVQAIEAVARGGTVVLAGTKSGAEVDGFVSDDLVLNGVTVRGTLGVHSWAFARAVDAIESGDYPFDRLHTHTETIDDLASTIRSLGPESNERVFHATVTPR